MDHFFLYAVTIGLLLSFTVFSDETDSTGSTTDSLTIPETSDTSSYTIANNIEKTDPKIKIVRRNFNYRTQIGSAVFMMAFIALILTSIQNWNPN